ncbi:hypothetical protein NDU88_003591 [Pleurodeles waltl]|uniref:Uncharacterized protein n=1 Tax=Pleurodeles waltl TaxID=8319 RepID=A0AAV7T5L7_PLEWA|nr:hypothetical protein NDU88_003591 [Pleurodeles waltl]
MGTSSDASETDFRIGERKATTDCTEGARCMEPRKTEEKQPPDAERELPDPAQTPETREAASTGTRDTTVYESRHDPGGSCLYKDPTSAEPKKKSKDKTVNSEQRNPQDVRPTQYLYNI